MKEANLQAAGLSASMEPAAFLLPRWVHRLAVVTAGATWLLICAGGLVKSKEAGLSVPDWPLSYEMPRAPLALGLALLTLALGGAWFFTRARWLALLALLSGAGLAGAYYVFGPSRWYVADTIRAEHGHRLMAGTVGFLTAILAASLWHLERRRWVRRLAVGALLAVLLQALLGGATVLTGLPPLVSAAHGFLAQLFFGLVLSLALVTAPSWRENRGPLPESDAAPLRKRCAWLVAALYLQVFLGTGVRHSLYTLETENQPGLVHANGVFYWHLGAHLLGLLFLGHTAARVLVRIVRRHSADPVFARPAQALGFFLVLQLLLGLGALWVRLQGSLIYDASSTRYSSGAFALKELVNTAHVAVGALSLGAGVWLLAQACRGLGQAGTLRAQWGETAEGAASLPAQRAST